MKKLFGLIILGLLSVSTFSGDANTNVITKTNTIVSPRPVPFVFDLLENNNGVCLVKYANRTLTVRIRNAPKTFYIDQKSFAKEDRYVAIQKERLRQWRKQLDYLDGQAAIGASGNAAYVDAVMAQREKVNALISQYNSQMSDLDAFVERLNEEKRKVVNQEPYHHPRRCQGIFVGKDTSGQVEWSFLR